MSETKTVRSTRGTSERVENYLKEQGLTMADYDKMPIKKSESQEHIDAKTRGNQFDWDFVPKEGIVTALPATKKMGNCNINHKVYIDRESDVLYGIPTGVDAKTGDLTYRKVFVTGNREFNLAKTSDREDFYTLIHSQYLRDGIHDASGKGLIIIDNPESDAANSVARFELSNDAADIIRKYSDSEIAELGVLFRISPSQKPVLIRGALYEKARKDPKHFLRVYNNDNRKIRVVVEKALHYRIVSEGPEGVLFGNANLGLRLEDAIGYLKEKLDLFGAIEQHVNEHEGKDTSAKKKPEKATGGRKIE